MLLRYLMELQGRHIGGCATFFLYFFSNCNGIYVCYGKIDKLHEENSVGQRV